MDEFCPDFFVVGAPKCGTTTIAEWLRIQNGLFLPTVKEPNYFNKDENMYASHSDSEYERLYQNAPDDLLLGEATPWYLSSKVAIAEIFRRKPSAKFIILIREHTEMAVAMHQQELLSGNEDTGDFGTAWNLQEERMLGNSIPAGCYSEKRLQYLKACSVGQQLENLLSIIDPDNILVISMNALSERPRDVKKGISKFLNFDADIHEEFPVANARNNWVSPKLQSVSKSIVLVKKYFGLNFSFGLLARFGQRRIKRIEINNELKITIEMQFLRDKKLLEQLLCSSLSTRFIK